VEKEKIIGSYEHIKNKILIECQYGHQWKPTADDVKRGSWCSIYNKLQLERKTRLFLEQNILFKTI
jgi:hypothetical protein